MSKGDVSKSNIRLEYPWTKGSEYLFNTLDSGNQGISAASAKERLVQYGPNSLKGKTYPAPTCYFLVSLKVP